MPIVLWSNFAISESVSDQDVICKDLYKTVCSRKRGESYNDGTVPKGHDPAEMKLKIAKSVEEAAKSGVAEKFDVDNRAQFWTAQNAVQTYNRIDTACSSDTSVAVTTACKNEVREALVDEISSSMAIENPPSASDPRPTQLPKFSPGLKFLSVLQSSKFYKDSASHAANLFSQTPFIKEINSKTKEVFENVQELLAQYWEQNKFLDKNVRTKMAEKIRSIVFSGNACHQQNTPTLLMANAYYQPDTTPPEFRVCPALLADGPSEFKLAHTIAHELGHSLGPCLYSTLMDPATAEQFAKSAKKKTHHEAEGLLPFGKVVQCLRDEASANAKTFVTKTGTPPPPIETIDSKSATFDSLCSRELDNGGKLIDQTDEAFADWQATEILPQYIQKHLKAQAGNPKLVRAGLSNIWPKDNMCLVENLNVADEHPLNADRMNGIIQVQPELRKLMGCGPVSQTDRIYCPISGLPEKPKGGPGKAKNPRRILVPNSTPLPTDADNKDAPAHREGVR